MPPPRLQTQLPSKEFGYFDMWTDMLSPFAEHIFKSNEEQVEGNQD